MPWTRQRCEEAAIVSHNHAIGREVVVSRLDCFAGGSTRAYATSDPIRVRIIDTPEELLLQWEGDYLDPKWCVEPLEPIDLDAASIWIYDPKSWLMGHGPV
jgi:hypothetical protein